MKTTHILYTLSLVVLGIFSLGYAWEFVLEDRIVPLLTHDFEPEPTYERWEYVVTATLFTALALVVPAVLLIRMAAGLRRFNSELEARVDERTRELHQELAERRQMEAQIVAARQQAEKASAAKSLFLGNLSHELRTPLSAVIGMSEALEHTALSSEQQRYVETIRNASIAFLDVIDGLLDLSVVEAGRFRATERDLDLHAVVEAMLDMVSYRACQRGLELLSCVNADVPVNLRGDPLALRQILLNLLGNAVKFTDEGVVDLRVSLLARAPQGCRLRFAVRDTGVGIPVERQTELFQPFSQGAVGSQLHLKGAGLGLHICKTLVESMQGNIGVESQPGEGSVFWFELDFEMASISGDALDGERPFAGLRALVVDDNPRARSILQEQLQQLAVRVEAVADVNQALEVLRRTVAEGDPCACALVDVDMPDIDGLSLAFAIKSEQALAETRVLMLTAVDSPIVRHTEELIGFDMQYAKPIKQSQLADVLRALLGEVKPAIDASPVKVAAPGVDGRPPRVLVVDDQPVNQEVMQIILRRLDCDVALADSGEQALELLREQPADIAFMDCLMPGMDGYATTAAIRASQPDQQRVVVIAMTALALPGERERCLAAGMDDYLVKPVNEAVLRRVLSQWLPAAGRDNEAAANVETHSDAPPVTLRHMRVTQPELASRLVDLFRDDTCRSLEAMRQTLKAGDGARLAGMAHALKGSCQQLDETVMADLCSRLEDAGHSGDLDAAQLALTELSEAFRRAEAALLAMKAAP